jgi:hypothetical protein
MWSKSGRCVSLTSLTPTYAGHLEIWELQHPGKLGASPGLYISNLTFTY